MSVESDNAGSGPRPLDLFRLSIPFVMVVAGIGILFPDVFTDAVSGLTRAFFRSIDWFFLTTVTGMLFVAIWLAVSRFGSVRLGRDDEEPEFSTASWLAMLFAAGMGVGLLFWGVSEPLTHYVNPPVGEPRDPLAAQQSLVLTLFHWGFHAWAVYCIGALVLAYFHYRLGAPFLPGSPIRASFQGRWVAPAALTADLVGIIAVAFGVAGSLASGVIQLYTGLTASFGVQSGQWIITIGILVLLFVSYMTSAATSLDKGIKILSNVNMSLAILLMLFLLVVGPTAFLLRAFVNGLSDYLTALPTMSLRLYPYRELNDWLGSWTLTYFIWWIAWSPFVGIFIARISRGRTIREFVIGVLAVPTLFSLVWFAVFGGSGIHVESVGGGGLGELAIEDPSLPLFALLQRLPLAELTSILAMVLVFVFIVTSVDSATFVLGMLTSQGALNPPTYRKLFWGIAIALLGAALALTDNIDVVRAGAISGALPLTFILLIQAGALIRSLKVSPPAIVRRRGLRGRSAGEAPAPAASGPRPQESA